MKLGDAVAAIIHATLGVKPCGKCQRRRESLNRMHDRVVGRGKKARPKR